MFNDSRRIRNASEAIEAFIVLLTYFDLGQTCKYKIVENGIINDENKKLSVGVKLTIRCKPSFFLWGPNETTCLESLAWSGYPQECVTLEKFRKNCEMDKRVMKIRYEGHRKMPYCYYSKFHVVLMFLMDGEHLSQNWLKGF